MLLPLPLSLLRRWLHLRCSVRSASWCRCIMRGRPPANLRRRGRPCRGGFLREKRLILRLGLLRLLRLLHLLDLCREPHHQLLKARHTRVPQPHAQSQLAAVLVPDSAHDVGPNLIVFGHPWL